MDGDWNVMIWALIPIIAIIGGIATAIVGTINKARIRELEIRERIAMIERGMVPAPEVDPHGFDRAMSRMDTFVDRSHRSAPERHRRAGVILMGVGFGLMVLIGFADRGRNISEAFGVGGFIVILGAAFLVSSLFGAPPPSQMTSGPTPSPRPPAPPAPPAQS
ncbi:MAG TPA: DUF6249 domain-containing protein [Vicinamibacterales bacterium]|nr:DUF6249 domain-containing protein [Vicinamibacterales bacterium]